MKKLLAIISTMVIVATLFVGCSQKSDDTSATTNEILTIRTVADENESDASTTSAQSTTKADESTSQTTTTQKTSETQKTTTKAQQTTIAKSTTKATTNAPQTTAKQTTKATTKATTTVKNVSASDVQAQVNSYIRSKGITVDSSLRPNNSGWSLEIAGEQVDLNSGYSLRACKEQVDYEIGELGTNVSLYCYFTNNTFYILYMIYID
jgi:FtsZ-interacting cell division protein ZipA